MGKLLKCHLKGKASKKLTNGQNIDYSENRKRPKGFICPCTGVKYRYHNIQTYLLVYAADSGERFMNPVMRETAFCIFKIKAQNSLAVIAKLINAFTFATR